MGDQERHDFPAQPPRPHVPARPEHAEGVPAEEDMADDAPERVDQDPDEQVNRPDQPDFSEDERRQYE